MLLTQLVWLYLGKMVICVFNSPMWFHEYRDQTKALFRQDICALIPDIMSVISYTASDGMRISAISLHY